MNTLVAFRITACFLFALTLSVCPLFAYADEMQSAGTFEVTETAALTSSFTLQGKLTDAGIAATGVYDFQFQLFDASAAGTPQGSTITIGDQAVVSGVFTVQLNFGDGLLGGDARWVEVGVRPGASGSAYTILSPRTEVGSAAQALSLPNVYSNPGTNFVGIGRNFRISGNEVFGLRYTGTPNQYGGMYVETSDAQGWPFYGFASGGAFRAWTYLGYTATDSQYWALYMNGIRLRVPRTGGLRIASALDYSLVIENTTGSDGIRILDTGDDGIQIGSSPDVPNYGVYIPSPGVSTYGLWPNTANASGQWALYTVDNIQAGNVVASAYSVIARVEGGRTLETGDIVAASGVGDAIPGGGYQLAHVRAAEAGAYAGLIGVVESRMVYDAAPGKEAEGEMSMHSQPGPAQVGDYVSLIVYGVAQVKIDPSAPITAGQRLTASDQAGRARALRTATVSDITVAEDAPTIGVALAAPTPGKATIPVFVTAK